MYAYKKFNIATYNCHHFLAALMARMAGALAANAADRRVFHRQNGMTNEYEFAPLFGRSTEESLSAAQAASIMPNARKAVVQNLLDKLVKSTGFSSLARGLKLRFDEEGGAGDEYQYFNAATMAPFFDAAKPIEEGQPKCAFCLVKIDVGGHAGFHCNGRGGAGGNKRHWLHPDCLSECCGGYDNMKVDDAYLLPAKPEGWRPWLRRALGCGPPRREPAKGFTVLCLFCNKDVLCPNEAGTGRFVLTTRREGLPADVKDKAAEFMARPARAPPSSDDVPSTDHVPDETQQLRRSTSRGAAQIDLRTWLSQRLFHVLQRNVPLEKVCPQCACVLDVDVDACRAVTCSMCKAKFCHLCDHSANFPTVDVFQLDPCHAHVTQHTPDKDYFCSQAVAEPIQRVATLRRFKMFVRMLRGELEKEEVLKEFWNPSATMGFATLLEGGNGWRKELGTLVKDKKTLQIVVPREAVDEQSGERKQTPVELSAAEIFEYKLSEQDAAAIKQNMVDKIEELMKSVLEGPLLKDAPQVERDAVLGRSTSMEEDGQELPGGKKRRFLGKETVGRERDACGGGKRLRGLGRERAGLLGTGTGFRPVSPCCTRIHVTVFEFVLLQPHKFMLPHRKWPNVGREVVRCRSCLACAFLPQVVGLLRETRGQCWKNMSIRRPRLGH